MVFFAPAVAAATHAHASCRRELVVVKGDGVCHVNNALVVAALCVRHNYLYALADTLTHILDFGLCRCLQVGFRNREAQRIEFHALNAVEEARDFIILRRLVRSAREVCACDRFKVSRTRKGDVRAILRNQLLNGFQPLVLRYLAAAEVDLYVEAVYRVFCDREAQLIAPRSGVLRRSRNNRRGLRCCLCLCAAVHTVHQALSTPF